MDSSVCPTSHQPSLFLYVLVSTGGVLLSLFLLFINTVVREVMKKQGADALAEEIHQALLHMRAGLRPRTTLADRPLTFYAGGATFLLIFTYMNVAKVFGWGATDFPTALGSMFNLTTVAFLIPLVAKRWPTGVDVDHVTEFASGAMMTTCVGLVASIYLLAVWGFISAVAPV